MPNALDLASLPGARAGLQRKSARCWTNFKSAGCNQTKAAEPWSDRSLEAPRKAPREKKSKLTARPQYEARAHVIYFDFFFFPFFFFFIFAMAWFPSLA
jgi:hypothetical protein